MTSPGESADSGAGLATEPAISPPLARTVTDATEAMSIKYNTMVYELQRAGVDVVVMSLGEAFFDIPLWPMDDLPYPALYHYSHSRGIPELRQKLSEYFADKYKYRFDPDTQIIVTAGSKVAIHMALMAITDPGDEIIIPEPAWVSYPEQVKLCHGTPVCIPCDAGLAGIEKAISSRTKALIINTPHNPRGYIYTREEIEGLLALAREHGFWLFSDEAYSDFVLEDEFVSVGAIDRQNRHSVIFNSISKNYGISGWRLGYVISNPRLIYQVLKVNQHLITCPATILEHYIARHFHEILELTLPQIRDVVRKRNELCRYMDTIGLRYMPGSATFYVFVSIEASRLGSEEFCTRLLQERRVSTVPGIGYGASCDRFIRVSVGTATMQENRYGLEQIRSLIEETRR
jgi:aspartate aminotransferase/aminotransferase